MNTNVHTYIFTYEYLYKNVYTYLCALLYVLHQVRGHDLLVCDTKSVDMTC